MGGWEAAGLALVPAAGCALGGLASERLPVSTRAVSLALHLAAGVVVGIVAVEIVPRALAADRPWVMVLAFVGGGVCFLGADAVLGLFRGRGRNGRAGGGPLLIYVAVAIDLASDGVMIGAAATLAGSLAARLAFGLLAADVPAGLATMAALKRGGEGRATRQGLNAAFALAALAGAAVGQLALRAAGTGAKVAILSLTGGILVTAAVEEMIPEAHEEKDSRLATVCFVGGFALFMLASTWTG